MNKKNWLQEKYASRPHGSGGTRLFHVTYVWGKRADWAARLAKGTHIEVEGELRYRTYQKEVKARTRAVSVDVLVGEIHANVIRKLDRPVTASGESEPPEGTPE